MRINVTTLELLEREALIDAALSANLSLAFSKDERRADPKHMEHLAKLRDLIVFRDGELRAMAKARTIAADRYLGGTGALFPNVATTWEEQIKSTDLIADMAVRMAEIDGVPAATPADPEAISRQVAELVADLVEPAKADALQKLDEGKRAFDIANAWVRGKLAQALVGAS